MTTLLSVDNISKQFANHKALDGVSLQVPKGSIYGLLGPNGAGKTTLIRIINQITGPDTGEVLYMGNPLNQEHIYKIGYLPEERGLYKKMKVGEQALYLARLKGLSKADATQNLKQWFEKFEITPWWNRKVEELSKGMQQKVQFIVTVVHKPDLLIFDEPFSGFDPINVNLIKDEILTLKENGSTIIFSTHNMASVEELCDQMALIDQSRVILEGNIHDIKSKFRSNTFEIQYTPQNKQLTEILGPEFNIVEEKKSIEAMLATVKIGPSGTKKAMLEKLMTGTELHGFQEHFPSINDIFIRTVTENSPNNNIGHE